MRAPLLGLGTAFIVAGVCGLAGYGFIALLEWML